MTDADQAHLVRLQLTGPKSETELRTWFASPLDFWQWAGLVATQRLATVTGVNGELWFHVK